jgi:hypothetical protein
MLYVVAALYVMAAVLPIAGFVRVFLRVNGSLKRLNAIVAERGYSHSDWGAFNAANAADVREPFRTELRDVKWETTLVGSGLTLGAVASIWSLFL